MAEMIKPNYIMRKSAWCVIHVWEVLLLLLSIPTLIAGFVLPLPEPFNLVVFALAGVLFVVPAVIMAWNVINIMDETISIYYNKVVQRSGILAKYEHTNILTNVLSVTVKQTMWGRIFNYGTITIDTVGPWDIDMKGIKDPMKAKEYLENYAANGLGMQQFIMN